MTCPGPQHFLDSPEAQKRVGRGEQAQFEDWNVVHVDARRLVLTLERRRRFFKGRYVVATIQELSGVPRNRTGYPPGFNRGLYH